ncbi:VPLPA-CTERM-specific exosortase XrtD [Pikeienuella piscinae]|uniref:VPLPA-CTERM-specific exosortase XrtD n=1 Tax=Pikeienuella piscinae TaxID=2748098 RepID=A0A7M3T6K5_9RHOB|nr:VPLPA-CTERM-specific exosortase XrtD [Pikeienuella piscinae]QIE57636.1 VPLPA-CTERM-specific exosortase XrtD [Pikeienuella piscinae]
MVAINSGNNTAGAAAAHAARRFGPGFFLFILLIVSGVALFWNGFFALFEAWRLPEYSHGPLIPVLSFYLFLRQLNATPPPPQRVADRWPGVAVVVFTLLIALLGNVTHIPDIVTYAMILWFYGVLLVGFGWRYGRQYWPPVLHLVFMLPLPAFMYWQLSINLQFVSSEIGVALIRLMNIPVFLDGNVIDLGVYKLQVAEACSGLRYLFPVMSFSYIFAVLYQGPVWHKAVLLLSAAPITVLMNSFRIGMIGVMVDSYGIEQAEGFLHFFEGWVIFISCVLILFGMARLMQKIGGDRRPLAEALDLEFSGLGGQMARILSIRMSAGLAMIVLLTGGAGLGWHLAPERQIAEIQRDPLVLFPREIGSWRSGPAQILDPNVANVLGADDYHSAAFASPDAAAPVDLFIAYYYRQTEGDGIHSPEVCIPAGGWEMSKITPAAIQVEGADGETTRFSVNRAVIQKGLSKQLVYYWFEERGRRLTSDYMAKATTVVDALTMGRTDGGLVRVITPIGRGEPEGEADARLQAFLDDMLDVLPRFVPD